MPKSLYALKMSSLILGIPNYEKININQKLTYSPSLETSKV
jgi:hypothetical protein